MCMHAHEYLLCLLVVNADHRLEQRLIEVEDGNTNTPLFFKNTSNLNNITCIVNIFNQQIQILLNP